MCLSYICMYLYVIVCHSYALGPRRWLLINDNKNGLAIITAKTRKKRKYVYSKIVEKNEFAIFDLQLSNFCNGLKIVEQNID